LGVKRTCLFAVRMSAFDPKRTSQDKCPLSVDYLRLAQVEANDIF
jgi:hypothetical protein